jgi:AcrR family transcriptional regulator
MPSSEKIGTSAPRAPVTVDRIVEAALAMIDEHGLGQLSMRKLGGRLGVEAMTLYHHVPNKDAVLDLLVERVITQAGLFEADEALDWRERLERFAHRYRGILIARPNLVPLIATRPVRSPQGLRELAALGATLLRAGFTVEQCFHVGNAVAMLVIGAALAQVGQSEPASAKADDTSALAQAMSDPASPTHDHDAIFCFALKALLDGVAIAKAPGPSEGQPSASS